MARTFTRSQRLKKSWSASQTINGATVTQAQVELASIILAEGILGEPTLLRTRGEVLLAATPGAIADSDVVGLGLVIVPETTRAIGGVSLPGPIADASADFWLWHRFVGLDAFGAATEAAARTGGTAWARVTIDAKAMRRWPSDSSLVLVAEATQGDFTAITANGQFRALTGI